MFCVKINWKEFVEEYWDKDILTKLTKALTETPVWMGFREHVVLLFSGR